MTGTTPTKQDVDALFDRQAPKGDQPPAAVHMRGEPWVFVVNSFDGWGYLPVGIMAIGSWQGEDGSDGPEKTVVIPYNSISHIEFAPDALQEAVASLTQQDDG